LHQGKKQEVFNSLVKTRVKDQLACVLVLYDVVKKRGRVGTYQLVGFPEQVPVPPVFLPSSAKRLT
jgi:hypothetical protein